MEEVVQVGIVRWGTGRGKANRHVHWYKDIYTGTGDDLAVNKDNAHITQSI